MPVGTLVAGSLQALSSAVASGLLGALEGVDVVVVPTAAAFTGATEAAVKAASVFDASGANVEALVVTDRAAANDPYFAQRVTDASWAVLTDGSALHARTTWRATALGAALYDCPLIAVGSIATVLGEEMVDPRGGAPTTGLGWRHGAVLALDEPAGQLQRTRELLEPAQLLIIIGPEGVVVEENGVWRQASEAAVAAERGGEPVELERFSSR